MVFLFFISKFLFPVVIIFCELKRWDSISHGDAIKKVLGFQFPYMESEDPDAINEYKPLGKCPRNWGNTYISEQVDGMA